VNDSREVRSDVGHEPSFCSRGTVEPFRCSLVAVPGMPSHLRRTEIEMMDVAADEASFLGENCPTE
jgi:hypothetical protein